MLVADLLRLSAALPPALIGGASSPSASSPVLFDFRYLKDPEAAERRVEADRHLAALDDAFREVRCRAFARCFASPAAVSVRVEFHRGLADVIAPSCRQLALSDPGSRRCSADADAHSRSTVPK